MHRAWNIINDESRQGLGARALRGISRVAAWGYGLGAGLNQLSYDIGWREIVKMSLPVIGVGNITVGGTGKTPLTMEVVRALLELGHKPVIISRGYGRQNTDDVLWVSKGAGPLLPATQCGDEPYLLAKCLPVPVLVGKNRVKLVQAATAALGKVVIVGDDLFQHRRLYRDLDILAMDSGQPLGNGFMLPRGPLREPRSALRRAQAIVLTNCNDEQALCKSKVWLRSFWGQGLVMECRHKLSGIYGQDGKLARQPHGPVLAFCGLAKPQGFVRSLRQFGLNVVDMVGFADHHWYSRDDMQMLYQRAMQMGATALVCTEKDAVRLDEQCKVAMPVLVSKLSLEFKQNHLASLLQGVLTNKVDVDAVFGNKNN